MRVFTTLLLSAALALPLSGQAWAQSLITVTGEATIEATPDMATVSLEIGRAHV